VKTIDKQNISYNETEIVFILNSYEDLFSDFDARAYIHKSLSYDFLTEIKRASKDKNKKIQLRFLLDAKKRNLKLEKVIEKRLIEHFYKHFNLINEERKQIITKGIIFTAIGIIIMLLATFMFLNQKRSFLTSFIIVILEPAGWFFFWEGLNQTIFESKRRTQDYDFYKKMKESEIMFSS